MASATIGPRRGAAIVTGSHVHGLVSALTLLGSSRRRSRWEPQPDTSTGADPSSRLHVCPGVADILFSANFRPTSVTHQREARIF
ncbi:MAG: hypothetical protein AVDCRST_MAG12-1156 [uncultured Rubrobacteraceae bacterium]|uniref:Uncharacterized protein n=1 Tax=uncultured Rubrobacteraceae bacterium TaxID=349277 RepID=A0A6J4RRC9_9ACTN|nr:MAG: hypothetical protein AVDCRST_MAG12-1156 [uncultured Rubrobacteraceae bacterium]